MVALQISSMDWIDRPKSYKDLYGILQLLQGSHLGNFSLKTLLWLGSFLFINISAEMFRFSIYSI